jgi:hypothetical protein
MGPAFARPARSSPIGRVGHRVFRVCPSGESHARSPLRPRTALAGRLRKKWRRFRADLPGVFHVKERSEERNRLVIFLARSLFSYSGPSS